MREGYCTCVVIRQLRAMFAMFGLLHVGFRKVGLMRVAKGGESAPLIHARPSRLVAGWIVLGLERVNQGEIGN